MQDYNILTSLLALGCGLLHNSLVDSVIRWSPSLGRAFGSYSQGAAIGLLSVSALFFTTIFTDLHPLLSKSRKWLLNRVLRLDFQVVRVIHNLFVLITLGFLLHILFTTTLLKYPRARWIFIAQFGLSLVFYFYNKVFKLVLPRYRFVVDKIISESENTVTVELKPKSSGKIYPYLPGQFVFIRFLTNSILMEEHPFSISSNPLNTGSLSVTVKGLGNYTSLLRNLKIGTKAVLDYPYGTFSIPESLDRGKIVLIAGGIGITPFLSYLAYLSEKRLNQTITLIWGVRTPGDLLKKDFFNYVQTALPGFRLIPIVSRHKHSRGIEDLNLENGYFDEEKAHRLIGKDLTSSEYFICGPRIMMHSVKQILTRNNVSKERIHAERFSM